MTFSSTPTNPRCVDPLSWVAEDGEDDAAVYGRETLLAGPRRRRRGTTNDDNDTGPDNEGAASNNSAGDAGDARDADADADAAAAAAAGTECPATGGYWTDIDLDASAYGEEGGDDDGSPIVVTSPFLRIAPDTDAFRCTAVTALTGSLRVSPLTVQAPPRARSFSALGRRRTRSFFLDDEQPQLERKPRAKSDAMLCDGGGDGDGDGGGGASVALRAPWDGGGVACAAEADEAGGAAEDSGAPGGGSPAPPSCLDQAAGAGRGGVQEERKEEARSRWKSARASDMAVEPLHEVTEEVARVSRKKTTRRRILTRQLWQAGVEPHRAPFVVHTLYPNTG